MKVQLLCFVCLLVVASATAAPADSTTTISNNDNNNNNSNNKMGPSATNSTTINGHRPVAGAVGHQLTAGTHLLNFSIDLKNNLITMIQLELSRV